MEDQVEVRQNARKALLEQARELSSQPGVYLMMGQGGGVLYVGKAKNLKNRVSTYFQVAPHEAMRIELLVGQIDHFEVILTETESEALILECTLIKKHKPKFNVRLKDDKTYPYIKIQLNEAFPRLEWTRRVLRDEAQYFGPFPSAWSARQVLKLLTETFLLRDCSDNTFRHRSRPCLLYQMQRCSAPCVGKISAELYRAQLQEASRILEGKTDALVQSLSRAMKQAAEDQEYELAAEYRDKIQNLRLITEIQGVVEAGVSRDRDVVGFSREGIQGQCVILQIRAGKLISVKHYHVQNLDSDLEESEILSEMLAQHYLQMAQEAQRAEEGGGARASHPPHVLLPFAPDDSELLERTLSLGIRVAETDLDRQLLNVAAANAVHALEMGRKRIAGHGIAALEEVQEKLHLDRLPARIECYDISNIQGEDAVASRVVFVNGTPEKNLYRRYKIRTVEGANDFAMMREVLGRRFLREEVLPDLVIVDGGRGQLAQAVAILEELNVQGIGVVGLAKARVESDFRSPVVESSRERVFIPNRKNPVPLFPHTEAYKLLTHVRDEAHRFAIQYHRKLRDVLPHKCMRLRS